MDSKEKIINIKINELSRLFKLISGVTSAKGLTNALIDKTYFKIVYGKTYKEEQKMFQELNDINKNINLISLMPDVDKDCLIKFLDETIAYVYNKQSSSYGILANAIFDRCRDISLKYKDYLKQQIKDLDNNERISNNRHLQEGIAFNYQKEMLYIEELMLAKEQEKKDKFYAEQQKFIEYEETPRFKGR